MAWAEQSSPGVWRVRYRREDGTIGSTTGFTNATTARAHANTIEADQRKGIWIDPAAGQITVAEFLPNWLDALDVDTRTEDNYRSMLRIHIGPRWGDTPLGDITGLKVHAWTKTLRATGLADTTVAGILKLFTMILADATDEKIIPANPITPRRRGRRTRTTRPREQIWAEPADVLLLADNIATYYHPTGAVLTLTAAYTGARWGELTGLQRHNLHLNDDDTGTIIIDPDTGALHESGAGRLWLGPPKTPESARTITLPPFLVHLLHAHLATHHHPHVFTTPEGTLHRRSNYARRAQRPAADGTLQNPTPRIKLQPAKPGLKFHGLRHSHKTWLIDDLIPEIAQAQRLGHTIGDKIRATYSHVSTQLETRILDTLQQRWEKTLANHTPTGHDTTWRNPAGRVSRSV